MTLDTSNGGAINQQLVAKYFKSLINRFFKILPMREASEATLETYMRSLQAELLGCGGLIPDIGDDTSYLTLMSILQYLIDNSTERIPVVKREVFRAINICSKLEAIYRCKAISDQSHEGGDGE